MNEPYVTVSRAGLEHGPHYYIHFSEKVIEDWITNEQERVRVGQEFVTAFYNKPRPLTIWVEGLYGHPGTLSHLFHALNTYVKANASWVLAATVHPWEWLLRDPQLEDLL